ncbi:MAG: GIY-YIG nuclease family protein, partial [Flavobacteriales bacterium]
MEDLKQKLSLLPYTPGVYQFINAEGNIIYVGKAKSLRNRVSSYFNRQDNGKTRILVSKICDIKIIEVETETDALLLENSLIKKYRPRYNILLKDDKTYPWIVIKNEPFPRIFSTRLIIKDGSEYFGPYASVKQMYAILELIKESYPFRSCQLRLSEQAIAAG